MFFEDQGCMGCNLWMAIQMTEVSNSKKEIAYYNQVPAVTVTLGQVLPFGPRWSKSCLECHKRSGLQIIYIKCSKDWRLQHAKIEAVDPFKGTLTCFWICNILHDYTMPIKTNHLPPKGLVHQWLFKASSRCPTGEVLMEKNSEHQQELQELNTFCLCIWCTHALRWLWSKMLGSCRCFLGSKGRRMRNIATRLLRSCFVLLPE